MAKTCTVCHQTYPDHLKACPHCEKRRAEDSSVIRLHDPNATDSWEGDPSSSTNERRGDVITMPGGSPEDSAIEILPDKGSPPGQPIKKKTQLAPKGRETKLHGLPSDEADLGGQPSKPGRPSAPETMIASREKTKSSPGGSSEEIILDEKKSGSSDDLKKKEGSSLEISLGEKPSGSTDDLRKKSGASEELVRKPKEGSSVEINLDEKSSGSSDDLQKKSGSSEELVRKKKEGSSVEINLEEQKSGSSVELDRKKKAGSSVQRAGSSIEINLDEKEDDDSPSSSLLLGGPGSDAGSSQSYSNELEMGASTQERGHEASMVDLGSSVEVNLDEEAGKAADSDSSVVTAREDSAVAVAEPPPSRRKRGGGAGLLIACVAGLLVASLLWIFGPLDGLRGSLRDTVGLGTEKKAQAQIPGSLKQIGIPLPAAKQQDDDDAPSGKEEPKAKPAAIEETKETKPAPAEEKEPKPAPAPENQPIEKKPETPPAPAPVAEKPPANKNAEAITMIAEAAKLAQEQKYEDAGAMLQKARAAGDKSDEGLRRFCDELQASWQVREKLGTAGYLKSQKDPAQALETLLKEKDAISATIAAAQEKIQAKGGTLAEAIESLLDSKKKADEQAKTAQAAMKKLEKEKEDSQSALQNASTLLKEGKYLDDQSPNLAQGVEKLLADKKNTDAQVKEANAKLKDAEETIQDMTKKLVAPRDTPRDTPQPAAPTISTSAKVSPPDITVAEKYYSAGLTHFWNGDYASAEKDFATAAKFYPDDARFFYYLGLSYWQEGKRTEASDAFQKGNALELRSRPSSPVINATFERIQGAARKALDQERELPQVQ